jgi:hypothetical protein
MHYMSWKRNECLLYRGSDKSGEPRMQRKADRPKRNVGYIANNNRAAEAATDPL